MLLILILADYKFLMYQRDALYYIACITIETKKISNIETYKNI